MTDRPPTVTSDKQIAANGRNAKHSTGPRTATGKAKVRANAVKHGILADEALLRSGSSPDDEAEFAELLAHLHDDYRPESELDKINLQRMAINILRLKRVQQREVGLRRQALDAAAFQRQSRQRLAVHRAIEAAEGLPFPPGSSASLHETTLADEHYCILFETPTGLEYVLEVLEAVKAQVVEGHAVGDGDLRCLARLFGTNPSSLFRWLERYASDATGDGPEAAVASAHEPAYKADLLAYIDREVARLKGEYAEALTADALDAEAEIARNAVPPEGEYDVLLRYETTFERKIRKTDEGLKVRWRPQPGQRASEGAAREQQTPK